MPMIANRTSGADSIPAHGFGLSCWSESNRLTCSSPRQSKSEETNAEKC